jgi:exonuclease SbcC
LKESRELFTKLAAFLAKFDVASLEEKQQLIADKTDELDEIQNVIDKYEDQLERQKRKIMLLSEVPCGSEYSHCKFIKDAYSAKKKLTSTIVEVEKLSVSKKEKQKTVENLQPEKINDHITKYEQVVEKRSMTQNEISSMELSIEKNKTKMLKIKNKLEALKVKKKDYEENKDVIENLESLIQQRESLKAKIQTLKEEYSCCQQEVMELYKTNGFLEQRLQQLIEEEEEYKSMRSQYAAYDLFMRGAHANGISYDIIKKRLPLINDEIAKTLTNIVDFEIFFENDDKKLNILIKHPGYEARPIEMGSGAEKTIAAMAIRFALLNVSTLPKSDIFVLDEPGTALDEENMEGFTRILDMIKTQFKTVLLISHLDSLKDAVDTQIMIDKSKGFAHVNQ